MIAALINEPSPSERRNCIALNCCAEKVRAIAGSHGWSLPEGWPCIITLAPLKAGDELLVSYGSEYARDYAVGDVRAHQMNASVIEDALGCC